MKGTARRILMVIFIILPFVLATGAFAQDGYGQYMDNPGGWNYCPYCGRSFHHGYGMGPGMMGPGMMGPGMMGPGMMGPGMMGPGMMGPGMMGPGMMGPGYGGRPGFQQYRNQEPLKKEEARELVEDMVKSSRNPNLKVGDVEDKGNYFEARIVTKKDESLVDQIQVDKETGAMQSAYY